MPSSHLMSVCSHPNLHHILQQPLVTGQSLGQGQSGLSLQPRSDKCLPRVSWAPGLREPGHHRHRTHRCRPPLARPDGRRLRCAPVTPVTSQAQVEPPGEKGPGPVMREPSHLPSRSSQAPPSAVLHAWGGSGKGCAVGNDVHDRAAGPAVVDDAGQWAGGRDSGGSSELDREGGGAGRLHGGCGMIRVSLQVESVPSRAGTEGHPRQRGSVGSGLRAWEVVAFGSEIVTDG